MLPAFFDRSIFSLFEACDINARYLDQDDVNVYDNGDIFQTQPYACGSAFTVSVLDSLVSAVSSLCFTS